MKPCNIHISEKDIYNRFKILSFGFFSSSKVKLSNSRKKVIQESVISRSNTNFD